MPVALTYPGVYIEELSSGVHTITGVATSIAAFVGWSPMGPTDQAGLVLSWADYARRYGGLDSRSYLGYAVNQFFGNGGSKAYIVRLAADTAKPAAVTIEGLTLSASSPGKWGKGYGIRIVNSTLSSGTFQLSVVPVDADGKPLGGAVEVFDRLSVATTDPRYVETVINADSALVRVTVASGTTAPPADTGDMPKVLEGGEDGDVLTPNTSAFEAKIDPTIETSAIRQLDRVDLFNLLCVPAETTPTTISKLQAYCRQKRAFMIVDCAQGQTFDQIKTGPAGITGADSINSALYFPWLSAPDPKQEYRPRDFPPCGFIAGIYARTDTARGVWKAPAGTLASVTGAVGAKATLTNDENGVLNPQAVNCIRNFPVYGTVVWGARTLQGNDQQGSEWKYVPVRRTALFIEESLYRGTQWVVFEPNDEPLWASIRLNVGAFMHDLFRQGAFQGSTPKDAYFVKCDKDTTTQNDIDKGIVNILVGFAPLKPAEFVVVQLQQMAGQIQT
ncbi:MAG: phage tail sheath subtilisin-like domain-containing protein [Burkholderiaceae bacterium]